MAMKIRLARGGSKKRPFYRIVAADSRMPRDGRFIEKLGTYNPLLPKDSEERVQMNMERVQYWLGEGAQPTDRIARMLEAAGVREKADRNNKQYDNDAVEALAELLHARRSAVRVCVSLESIRCQLEGPGENQGRNKAYGQRDNDTARSRLAKVEHREQRLDDLDNQPRDGDVACGYAQDTTALEFVE